MANFAAQLKDRFLGLIDRVAGCGRAGVKDAETAKPAPAVQEVRACTFQFCSNLWLVSTFCMSLLQPSHQCCSLPLQHVEIRARGPNVSGGSGAGVN
jgi:hypothetical protein